MALTTLQEIKHAEKGWYRIPARVIAIEKTTALTRLRLADFSGEIDTRLSSDYRGPLLKPGLAVDAGLSYLPGEKEHFTVSIARARLLSPGGAGPRTIPRSTAPVPRTLVSLCAFVAKIRQPALRSFVNAVFATPEIYNSFVRVAASHSHHHAFPGGLISHSLDATRLLLNLDLLDGEERELGIVGTLLHDIGKIRTLNPDGTRSRLGHVVDHGELTLEILAPWLTTLEHHWCDGAIALRHIWLPKRHHSGNYPESQIRELVRLVDQISALTNRCETEFEALPKWRNHVRGADRSHWWRPRKPHSLVNF